MIVRGEASPWLDLRCDDHAEPLAELRRLYAVAQERYLLFAEAMPTADDPSGLLDRSDLDHAMVAREAERDARGARKSVEEGKSVSVRVDSGGRRILRKKNRLTQECL